jgi:hypothetical protein
VTTGDYDFVVVGAPDANGGSGRVFIYQKAYTSDSFASPVEILPPVSGSRFGASVAIRWGGLAVGAPNAAPLGQVYTFTQAQDSNGFPIETSAFVLDEGIPRPFYNDSSFGQQVSLSFGTDRPLVACGSAHCETFYEVAEGQNRFYWNQIGPSYPGARAFQSETPALAIRGNDNTIKIYQGDLNTGLRSYHFTPDANLGPPFSGAVFGPQVAGSYDYFLGTVANGGGTSLYAYAPPSAPVTFDWSLLPGNPILALPESKVGTTIVNNTDTWLMSNTNPGGTAAQTGTVYKVQVSRAGSFYSYGDDSWGATPLATGGKTFGAGLALTPSFLLIGDPANRSVVAVGNDQQLVSRTVTSDGTHQVQITLTTLATAPLATVHEDPTCSNITGNLLRSRTGPCVSVNPNAEIVGLAKVCFPNNTGDTKHATIVRCTPPASSTTPSCPSGDFLYGGKCCSDLENIVSGTDPLCGYTAEDV